MFKRILLTFIGVLLLILPLSGCNLTASDQETYLTLMTVPMKATIPDVLSLVCILSVTNPDPANPEVNLPPVSLGVFGFTNMTGEIEYYIYGKKESVEEGNFHLIEEGFFPVDFFRDSENVSVSLRSPISPMDRINPGVGVTTAFEDVLPIDFYNVTEQPGVFNFTSAEGNVLFRTYSTFTNGYGNFYPATEDGKMIKGALPVAADIEATLKNAGTNAAARLLTTPIQCTNVQIVYQL